MSPNCIDVEHIADVESSPELRRHVDDCPRCQSLWLSYQSFMKADVSDAPHVDRARRELETLLRRKAAEGVERDVAPRASRMRVRSAWPAWLRPAIVTAVAAVLTVVAVTIFRGGGSEEPVLRGGAKTEWKLEAPRVTGIAIVFQWNAIAGADAYDVELYDDALNQVLHSAAVATPSITVDRAALASVPAGAELTWRVRALRGGDVIATSPPASLVLR